MALHSAPSSGFSVIPILCILAYKYILKMSYTLDAPPPDAKTMHVNNIFKIYSTI